MLEKKVLGKAMESVVRQRGSRIENQNSLLNNKKKPKLLPNHGIKRTKYYLYFKYNSSLITVLTTFTFFYSSLHYL
jgi:hypothetical protein